jgi:hypothetical protein
MLGAIRGTGIEVQVGGLPLLWDFDPDLLNQTIKKSTKPKLYFVQLLQLYA